MAHRQLPEMPAGPVLELHGQRKVFHIPNELKSLLEVCTREVLRTQPENIYEFLADLMDDRLLVREFKAQVLKAAGMGGMDSRKSWQWRRWSWDGSSLLTDTELMDFLSEFEISLEMANILALIIQSAYRGFMARKVVKGLKHDRDVRRGSLWEEWKHPGNMYVRGHDVLEILAYYGISLFEANIYATKIQSVFRGHSARKHFEELHPETAAHLHSLGITKKEADRHASKIQSAFRGYKIRKNLRDGKDITKEEYVTEDEDLEEETTSKDEQLLGVRPSATGYIDASELKGPEGVSKPKYEAFFAKGLNAEEEEEIEKNLRLPPKFTHEHFGEIDAQGLKEKFSTTGFKQQMGRMMRGLEEAKEEKRKENLEKVESSRRLNEDARLSANIQNIRPPVATLEEEDLELGVSSKKAPIRGSRAPPSAGIRPTLIPSSEDTKPSLVATSGVRPTLLSSERIPSPPGGSKPSLVPSEGVRGSMASGGKPSLVPSEGARGSMASGGKPSLVPSEGARGSMASGGKPSLVPSEGGKPSLVPSEGGKPSLVPSEGGNPSLVPSGGKPSLVPTGGNPSLGPSEGGKRSSGASDRGSPSIPSRSGAKASLTPSDKARDSIGSGGGAKS